MKPVIAIVPSAGSGKRFGGDKIFAELKGMPIIAWSLSALQAVDEIVEVIPVMRDLEMERGVEIVERYSFTKVKKIAPGGRERQESVYHGLKLINKKDCIVLIHDGVRPLATPEMIQKAITALENHDGVVAGVPLKDTVKEVKDSMVRKTLARDLLLAAQTPQVFPYNVLMEAYTRAFESGMHFTDDSAIVEHYGGSVTVIEGDYANIKITTPEDIAVAETYLRNRS